MDYTQHSPYTMGYIEYPSFDNIRKSEMSLFFDIIRKNSNNKYICAYKLSTGKWIQKVDNGSKDDMIAFFNEEGNISKKNIYMSINDFKPDATSGTDKNVNFINGIFLDSDLHKEHISQKEALEDISYALEVFADSVNDGIFPEPTMVNLTGRGLARFFLYKEPIDVTDTESVKKHRAIYKVLQSESQKLWDKNNLQIEEDFSVKDLRRVCRIPGSYNTKNGEVCTLYYLNDSMYYTVDELCDILGITSQNIDEKLGICLTTRFDSSENYKKAIKTLTHKSIEEDIKECNLEIERLCKEKEECLDKFTECNDISYMNSYNAYHKQYEEMSKKLNALLDESKKLTEKFSNKEYKPCISDDSLCIKYTDKLTRDEFNYSNARIRNLIQLMSMRGGNEGDMRNNAVYLLYRFLYLGIGKEEAFLRTRLFNDSFNTPLPYIELVAATKAQYVNPNWRCKIETFIDMMCMSHEEIKITKIYQWKEKKAREESNKKQKNLNIEQAYQLYDEGLTQEEIADIFGVHRNTIGRWLKKRPKEVEEVVTEELTTVIYEPSESVESIEQACENIFSSEMHQKYYNKEKEILYNTPYNVSIDTKMVIGGDNSTYSPAKSHIEGNNNTFTDRGEKVLYRGDNGYIGNNGNIRDINTGTGNSNSIGTYTTQGTITTKDKYDTTIKNNTDTITVEPNSNKGLLNRLSGYQNKFMNDINLIMNNIIIDKDKNNAEFGLKHADNLCKGINTYLTQKTTEFAGEFIPDLVENPFIWDDGVMAFN